MSPHRHTHPCPACGSAVSVTARFCGSCGAPLPDRRDRASELRAAMSGVVHRLEARESAPPELLLEAARALSEARVSPTARVVVLGELGRGTRALANLLSGEELLATGPSQRGAPAVLELDEDASGLRGKATLEVAPPLAEGSQSTGEGVIPALMRADVVIVALSAAQLLSATERRLLRSLAQLTEAPIALAVGRMDALETDEDREDVHRRTERFRETFGRTAAVFLLDGDDSTAALRAWVDRALDLASWRVDAAWELQARRVLVGLTPILADPEAARPALPELPVLVDQLATAHATARAQARSQLDDGLAQMRAALTSRLAGMSLEERVHEGASEVVAALEALVRSSVDRWKSTLEEGLAEVDLARASMQASPDSADRPDSLTDGAPRLSRRHPDQSVGLIGAAVGLSVGVLLLPVGGTGAIAMGVGLTAASYGAARVLRGRRDEELRQVHVDELDRWLREVGAQASDWLVDHVDGAHELMAARLTDLHAHAAEQYAASAPEALRTAVSQLQTQLTGDAPPRAALD